jgi:N-acetylmuramoyl-L-alanine amidase
MKYKILLIIFIAQYLFFPLNTFAQISENKITSISFENNALTINTLGKITYTESRLKDPDRLVLDILNCSLESESLQRDFRSPLDENVSVAEIAKGHVRILFFGRASINRKSFLSNNDRTLVTKIARIDAEPDKSDENNQQTSLERELPGKLKDILIEHKSDESEIQITTSKSTKFNTYFLKNPDRYAIDLLNVSPPEKPLPQFSSTPLISGLRVGRAANGVDATRVVIDLSKPDLECNVSSTLIGNKIKIKVKAKKQKEGSAKSSNIKVVIDPGHGGYDTGAQYGGFDEKDITLSISMKLKKELESRGVKVFITREEDSFLSLAERVDITNSVKPHVFVSVHANAMKSTRTIRGVETYYWTKGSQKLAYYIHKSILNDINIPDHFIRRAQFFVIKHTSVPAVLCELAFLSNHDDRKLLTSSAMQENYAKAVTDGILKFLDIDTRPIEIKKPVPEKEAPKKKEDKKSKV